MNKQVTTLGQLAELVSGHVQGDANLIIRGAAVLGEAADGEITLVDHSDRIKQLNATPAAAVLITEKIATDFLGIADDSLRD